MTYLPRHWLESLSNSHWLLAKVDAACYLMELHHMVYDYEADADTLIDGGKGAMPRDEMDGRVMMLMVEAEARIKEGAKVGKKRGVNLNKCTIM